MAPRKSAFQSQSLRVTDPKKQKSMVKLKQKPKPVKRKDGTISKTTRIKPKAELAVAVPAPTPTPIPTPIPASGHTTSVAALTPAPALPTGPTIKERMESFDKVCKDHLDEMDRKYPSAVPTPHPEEVARSKDPYADYIRKGKGGHREAPRLASLSAIEEERDSNIGTVIAVAVVIIIVGIVGWATGFISF